jgi:hypothetical protein
MTHTDVVTTDYFSAVLNGDITSEIRKVRTPVVTGDRLILQERDDKKAFTGKELELTITSAQHKVKGLNPGFALVHFKVKGDKEHAVTTTVIPADAQINAGVDRANVIDSAPPADLDLADLSPITEETKEEVK